MSHPVVLALFVPLIISSGGNSGSQAATLVIRAMALGQIGQHNLKWLLNREFIVSIINGVLWAVVVAAAAILWFEDVKIGLIIGSAIIINLVAAAIAGTILPIFLRSRGIDPALAGSVILTTVTDVVGFLSFLGLATLFLT